MLWLRKLMLLLPWIRRKREQSLNEELDSYLDMAAADARDQGIPANEARFAASRDLGSVLRAKEQVRGEWVPPRLDEVVQDLRYGTRTLLRAPLFTAVAVLSLGLGIGAATAMFSLVEAVLLKPLAYKDSGQLIYVREVVPAMSRVYPSLPVNIQHFFYWREHTKTFQSIAALRSTRTTLTGAGQPEQVDGVETTADLFNVLGVGMAKGRGFVPNEEQAGKKNVAVITDSLWRRYFHADPDTIGKSATLDGTPVTIIGILRPDFTFPKSGDLGALAGLGKRTEVFLPLQDVLKGWDGDYDYIVIGRLKPLVRLPRALAELTVLTSQMNTAHQVDSHPHPEGLPLQDLIAGPVRTSLIVLFAAVLTLLLIVCLNLTNLTLARTSVRAREFSLRTALGAGRRRLVQQVLTEIGILALVGGTLGVALSVIAIRLFVAGASTRIPRLDEVTLDAHVLLFSLLVTLGAAALVGLIPAYRIARSDPQRALRAGAHTVTAGKQSLRLRETLVGFEVALSTVLLFLAGLLIASLFHLMNVDKGFTEERAVAVDIGLPGVQYATSAQRSRFFDRALTDVRAIPGVRSAAMINSLPLTGESQVNGIELEGADREWTDASTRNTLLINVRFISPDYFATLGIPVLKGRSIKSQDRDRHVAVISARLAAKLWPGQNPLGKKFTTGSNVGKVEVVGVSRDTYNARLDQDPTLIVYVPYWVRGPNSASIVVRSAMDTNQLMPAIQRAMWSIDSSLPVPPLRTMSELVTEALAQRAFQMRLAGAFGAAALLLALIGIYGVVAYNVAQRRAELGLRLALGARRTQVMALMLRRGLQPVFIGLACGLVSALACGRLVASLLFGVTANDPLTIVMVALLLSATALAACMLPAYSAAHVDPATILRYE